MICYLLDIYIQKYILVQHYLSVDKNNSARSKDQILPFSGGKAKIKLSKIKNKIKPQKIKQPKKKTKKTKQLSKLKNKKKPQKIKQPPKKTIKQNQIKTKTKTKLNVIIARTSLSFRKNNFKFQIFSILNCNARRRKKIKN